MQLTTTSIPWTRANDGVFAGVCEGVARRFEVSPWAIRFLWLLSILGFGFGFFAYIILAISLPREDRVSRSRQKKLLGVCLKVSRKFDMDIGLLRAVACLVALSSVGTALLIYFILFFILPDDHESSETIDRISSRPI